MFLQESNLLICFTKALCKTRLGLLCNKLGLYDIYSLQKTRAIAAFFLAAFAKNAAIADL